MKHVSTESPEEDTIILQLQKQIEERKKRLREAAKTSPEPPVFRTKSSTRQTGDVEGGTGFFDVEEQCNWTYYVYIYNHFSLFSIETQRADNLSAKKKKSQTFDR